MFTAIITKQVHGCFAAFSSLDVYIEREVQLPFAPSAGITIKDGDWYSGRLIDVLWNCEQKAFTCYVEEDKELYEAGLHRQPARPIAEIIKAYTDEGWKVRERNWPSESERT